MNKYLVSVVITTYNSGNFILELFDSIKQQTLGFENIEVIIVDDCSNDSKTLENLNKLSNYSNVNVINLPEHSGFPGTGRNVGLENANGSYVIFSDHDDTYNDDAFEVMYNTIHTANADMLSTNYIRVFTDRTEPYKPVFNGETVIVNNVEEDLRLIKLSPAIWAKIFNRNFLLNNDIKFIEGVLAEDLYFYVYSLLNARKIIYLDGFYSYNYSVRDSEDNKSTINERTTSSMYKIIEGYYETDSLLIELNKTKYFSEIFKNHIKYFIVSLIKSNIPLQDKKDILIYFNPLLKKQLEFTPYLNDWIYYRICNYLKNDNYDGAIREMNFLKHFIDFNLVKKFLKLKDDFRRKFKADKC